MKNEKDEPERVDRKAMIWLSGYHAPTLACVLYEAERLSRRDKDQHDAIHALRVHIEEQIHRQFPKRGWSYNYD